MMVERTLSIKPSLLVLLCKIICDCLLQNAFTDCGKVLSHGWDKIQWLSLAGRWKKALPHGIPVLYYTSGLHLQVYIGFPPCFSLDFSHQWLQWDGCSISSDSFGLLQLHVVYLISYDIFFVSYIKQFKSEKKEYAVVRNCNIAQVAFALCTLYTWS